MSNNKNFDISKKIFQAQPGQQPGMAPTMVNHPMYAPHPPRPQQMAPPGGQGGYPGQPGQPGQHPQPQH